MAYKGKHTIGGQRMKRERYQRAGAGCLPASKLIAQLVAERGARGRAPVNELGTAVTPVRSLLVRPYVQAAS